MLYYTFSSSPLRVPLCKAISGRVKQMPCRNSGQSQAVRYFQKRAALRFFFRHVNSLPSVYYLSLCTMILMQRARLRSGLLKRAGVSRSHAFRCSPFMPRFVRLRVTRLCPDFAFLPWRSSGTLAQSLRSKAYWAIFLLYAKTRNGHTPAISESLAGRTRFL